ncbi:MAG: L-lactate permease, partial [Lactococcus lactis]|nr:L-lactate permease [Lactococcus lactis]
MIFLLLLPLILSLLLIIGFKKSGFVSGLIGVCSTLVISYMMESLQLDLGVLYNSLLNTIILTLSAFLVILPGLTLNNILEDHGYNRSLQGYLKEMPIDRNHKVMLLVFGLLPALESITGFGVSLILAVPVFISLLKQETALKVSMLSMNIMPWGTLGLATVVGSKISSQPIESVGFLTACMSLFVFIVLGGICSFVLNENEIKYKNFIFGISIASTISILLMIFNYMGQVEIAGVLSGLITFLIFFSFLLVKNNSSLISEYKNILMNIS